MSFCYTHTMIFLWIDPGTLIIGFALIEKDDKGHRIIEYGVITTKTWLTLSEKLVQISHDLRELIDTYRPSICGIEKLFFLRNVTNGIDVAHARWVILYTIAMEGIPIREYTPLQVKKWITWNGFAKKPQIQKSLQMIFWLSTIPKPDDAADALAIAYLTMLSSVSMTFPKRIR